MKALSALLLGTLALLACARVQAEEDESSVFALVSTKTRLTDWLLSDTMDSDTSIFQGMEFSVGARDSLQASVLLDLDADQQEIASYAAKLGFDSAVLYFETGKIKGESLEFDGLNGLHIPSSGTPVNNDYKLYSAYYIEKSGAAYQQYGIAYVDYRFPTVVRAGVPDEISDFEYLDLRTRHQFFGFLYGHDELVNQMRKAQEYSGLQSKQGFGFNSQVIIGITTSTIADKPNEAFQGTVLGRQPRYEDSSGIGSISTFAGHYYMVSETQYLGILGLSFGIEARMHGNMLSLSEDPDDKVAQPDLPFHILAGPFFRLANLW